MPRWPYRSGFDTPLAAAFEEKNYHGLVRLCLRYHGIVS